MSGFTVPQYGFLYQGLPAVGGSLFVYQTGTTTPVTIYADALLTTPLLNPLTLDANGNAEFYYSGIVNLKLVAFTASGTLIQTIDPVYPSGAAVGGGIPWVVAGGTSDVITATYNPVISALTDGLTLQFRATAANTTATPTFSPNGLTAHTITQDGGAALVAGNIAAALAEYIVVYNLANTRWELLNPTVQVQNAANISTYYFTDATDHSLSTTPTQTNISSTQTVIIPTTGIITIEFTGQLIGAGASCSLQLGIRIGSTNYWPTVVATGATGYQQSAFLTSATTNSYSSLGVAIAFVGNVSNNFIGGQRIALDIGALSIPTGSQTVQIIGGYITTSGSSLTLKGTVQTTKIYLTAISY